MTRQTPHIGVSDHHTEVKDAMLPVANATTPYWRSELHHLDEYRSTAKLPQECDIAIIGAGMSGVSLAYHLLKLYGDKPKPSIVLLEARQVCSGATGRNGGHAKIRTVTMRSIKEKHGVEVAEQLAALVNDQIYRLKGAVEEEKLECEFELRRSYDVFLDEKEAEEAGKAFFASVRNGEQWTRNVDFIPRSVAEQITSIKGAKAAFSMPVGSFWPYKFVTQLLERIVDQINLQTNTSVTSVQVERGSGLQVLQTSAGDLKAKKVVFASNGYTGGICPTYKDKIVPVRGTASHLSPFPKPVSPHLSNTYNIVYGPGHVDYLNPRPDGGIVVGGAKSRYVDDRSTWYNNWDDSKLIPNVENYFDGLMQRHFKGWEESGSKLDGHTGLWSGIMGSTSDGFPHIGEVPGIEGKQYILAGYNGGGMSLIYSSALGLAKMVKDQVPFAESGLPALLQPTHERLRVPMVK